MFNEIETWHVNQFSDNVVHTFQQEGSKLRGTVRQRAVTGSSDFWDRIGPTVAVKKTVRHGDTPQIDTVHSRRRVDLFCWEWADLLDKQDEYKLLISPRSEYAINGAKALARAFDGEVIRAFDADAQTGKDGTVVTSFTSECAADIDLSLTQVTVGSIVQAKGALDSKDVPEERRHIVLPPAGFAQLLKQGTAPFISSADYNTIKALVKGQIDFFLGLVWHKSTLLPHPAAGLTYGYLWHEDAIRLSISSDLTTTVTERADKSYATQVLVAASLGATRIQGEGVVRLKIAESH